jgi:hypothetical protein
VVKFLLFFAALVGGGWYYFKPLPPGKGANADAGKRAATVILRTVETYRGATGVYPMHLEDLIPDYLSSIPRLSNGSQFEYERLGWNYKLTFNYTNPLPVHCNYMPATKWECEWF